MSADRDLQLYMRAEDAAANGNTRMAEAISRLEKLNAEVWALRYKVDYLSRECAELEAAIIREAEELPA